MSEPKAAGEPYAVMTVGLARQMRELARILERPVVYRPPGLAAGIAGIVGWGRKKTSRIARLSARVSRLPYIAAEDGFLRSVEPGRAEPSSSYAIDRTGIYYDASRPSDLETLIASAAGSDRARSGIEAIRRLRLSKYNHAPPRTPAELGLGSGARRILVVDQTFGDASVAGAGADAASFIAMLDAAIAENPGAEIVVKTHPETAAGRKRGYLLGRPGVTMVSTLCEPRSLIESVDKVYTVSSLLGFEALTADRPVVCFGLPFYSGWGLTDDRVIVPPRRGRAHLAQVFEAAYLQYTYYIDAWRRTPIAFEDAIEQLAFLRDRYRGRGPAVCLGVSSWKHKAVRRMLRGRGGGPVFARTQARGIETAKRLNAPLVVWASKESPGLASDCESQGVMLERMEDGFLRSVGLGAKFVPPASLIVDAGGIYYDPSRPSGFERLALETQFSEETLARARRLRDLIVSGGLSKYNDDRTPPGALPKGRPRVLVPGQVEDDASIRLGTRRVATNLALLRSARARHPGAFILYKPHPDVASGLRRGAIPEAETNALADSIATGWSMPALLAAVDRVETMTSLTGFEALLRGKAVSVHGRPFYAGWGLTEDLDPVPRRTRRLGLDELVAVTLILYPLYIDPVSGRPCPPEVVAERFREALAGKPGRLAIPQARMRNLLATLIHHTVIPVARRFGR